MTSPIHVEAAIIVYSRADEMAAEIELAAGANIGPVVEVLRALVAMHDAGQAIVKP